MTLSLLRRVILFQPIIQTWQTAQHILHVCTHTSTTNTELHLDATLAHIHFSGLKFARDWPNVNTHKKTKLPFIHIHIKAKALSLARFSLPDSKVFYSRGFGLLFRAYEIPFVLRIFNLSRTITIDVSRIYSGGGALSLSSLTVSRCSFTLRYRSWNMIVISWSLQLISTVELNEEYFGYNFILESCTNIWFQSFDTRAVFDFCLARD